MEKISLITLLRTNEEGRREEETRLIKDMFDGVRVSTGLRKLAAYVQQTRHNAETMGETLELIQQEVSRQETLRHSMIMEIKQVMEGLSRTRDVLWDEVRLEGTGIALSLIQDIRRSHDEMIRSLAHQVRGRDHQLRLAY
jgi:vesicle coat complex subunit